MKAVRTELTSRCRTYGYFIWPKALDSEMQKLIPPETPKIDVHLGEFFIGERPIDWKYRRISLGYKNTRKWPETAQELIATKKRDGSLLIKCL
jgi:hypothetical protein